MRSGVVGWLCASIVAIGLISPCARAERVDAATLTDGQVSAARDALVDALLDGCHPERFWEPVTMPSGESRTQVGGHTALAVLALLHAGISYQDERLAPAIEELRRAGTDGTYAIANRVLVWSMLPEAFRTPLRDDAHWLLETFNERSRCWDYTSRSRDDYQDNSIRQYGALALWAAARRDVRVDRRYWRLLEDAVLEQQQPDGGWGYRPGDASTGSMTAAGLMILAITQDMLHAPTHVKLDPSRGESAADEAIRRGHAWFDRHFTVERNPVLDEYFYYYLYSLERAGLAAGVRAIGGHDWFREGAAELINRLCDWDAETGSMTIHLREFGRGNGRTIKPRERAFAILFLSRGRVPVAINKMRFDGAWNNRPRDVARLTAHIARESEAALNWQIVDMREETSVWRTAPWVYIASHEAPPWLTEDERPEFVNLVRYLIEGGLAFIVDELRQGGFSSALQERLTAALEGTTWRRLPRDHWAYTLHRGVRGRPPSLMGLTNGARDLVIVDVGNGLAGTYQSGQPRPLSHYDVGLNVYLFASEMGRPRPRLHRRETWPSVAARDDGPTVVVAQHAMDVLEPDGLQRLRRWLVADEGPTIRVTTRPLTDLADDLDPTLVLLRGVKTHAFTDAEQSALKSYIERGGWVLVETPGGTGAFTASVEQLIAGWTRSEVTSASASPVVTGEGVDGARDLSVVFYRPFALQTFGIERGARLRGIAIDGTMRVLFSREDLSVGLLDQPRWGISGYTPTSARQLFGNIIRAAAMGR